MSKLYEKSDLNLGILAICWCLLGAAEVVAVWVIYGLLWAPSFIFLSATFFGFGFGYCAGREDGRKGKELADAETTE